MKPLKILFIHGGTLRRAGTEAYMMNVFRHVDPKRIHIDFLVFGREEAAYDQEVITHGSKIYRIPYTPQDLKIKGISYSSIKNLIAHEKYDIVHSHMNALNGIMLNIMKKIGIPVRISHSHGSKHFTTNLIASKAQDIVMKRIPRVATNLMSCSKAAGDFLYGDNTYVIMNNGIDVEAYGYNEAKRTEVRNALNLEGKFVIGHVGRFNFQKNHMYLIDVFYEYRKLDTSAHLVLVGEGELEEKIVSKVQELGLTPYVTFAGVLNSTHEILQAFDCFVMPSLFEGLPYVLVEAQCAGLLCVVSDTIDLQTQLIDDFHFMQLEDPKAWAHTIYQNREYKRISGKQVCIAKGFDVVSNVNWLMNYYEAAYRGETEQ